MFSVRLAAARGLSTRGSLRALYGPLHRGALIAPRLPAGQRRQRAAMSGRGRGRREAQKTEGPRLGEARAMRKAKEC